MKFLQVTQIGGLAQGALVPGSSGKVTGITSKGIFLDAERRILFLTTADYKSPYNLQLPELASMVERLQVGDAWKVLDRSILFMDEELRVDINNAMVWCPEPLTVIETDSQYQYKHMQEVVNQIYHQDPAKGWAFLVPSRPQNSLEAAIIRMTSEFTSSYNKADLDGCLAASRPILGLGGGLTPSGDDWLAGFILLHARRNQATGTPSDFQVAYNKALIPLAFERTTSISANRIEAACNGWAEELFIKVADRLFTQSVNISEADLQTIVNFGHSSGVDTCMGIWAGLKTLAGK